jgi:hypothetical protein
MFTFSCISDKNKFKERFMGDENFLRLTYVTYREGDSLGHLLAWSSLIPIGLVVFEASAIVLAETRVRLYDAVMLLMGQLLNELLNYVLKKTFHMPRPQSWFFDPLAFCSETRESPSKHLIWAATECRQVIPNSWHSFRWLSFTCSI